MSADRGDGSANRAIAGEVARVRAALARMCGVPPSHCAFTSGATESLNLVLSAILREGDRVVTTAIEHASAARPLVALRTRRGLDLEVVPCDAFGRLDPDAVARSLRSAPTRLLVVNHGSNVTGSVSDVRPMIEAAHAEGAMVVLDASQTVGVFDTALGADLVIGSAHKALLGPPGLGFVGAAAHVRLEPPKPGGSGSTRALDTHPDDWPAVLEAGTPNTPAILGLGAALDWRTGFDTHRSRLDSLRRLDDLRQRLESLAGFTTQSPTRGDRLPILAFTCEPFDPAEIGAVCDAAGITVRSGHHCTPWIHRYLGTEAEGTVRVSPGPFINEAELMAVAAALVP